jgi:glycosyltransferase involved in cell wall biosynthesis
MPETQEQPTAATAVSKSDRGVRVAAFTGGIESSPRFRIRQYIPYLTKYGITVTEYRARWGSWPPTNKALRPLWLPATLVDRIPSVLRSYSYDVTFLQREMISTFVTLEGLTHRPRLLDVDDAVWLNCRAGKNFPRLVRMCQGVICGNEFLAEHVRRWNSEVCILPTAVDTEQFRPAENSRPPGERPVIGWTGVASNLKYLYAIEAALAAVLEKRKDAVLRVVSSVEPKFHLLDRSRVEYIRWSPENDVQTIQPMSVGLMPIEDTDWGRGKCSYKMLLYMSCGLPVVVSPVGMNNDVLGFGNPGFAARSNAEWADALLWLLDNPAKATEIGTSGRRIVEEHYSVRVLVPRLAEYIKRFVQ